MRPSARLVCSTAIVTAATLLALAAPAAAEPTPACPQTIPAAGYADVDDSNTHLQAIDCITWWEITTGSGFGTYQPASEVRRDQMATFIARVVEAIGGDLPRFGQKDFDDVEFSNPHRDNISRLVDVGLVQGTSEGRFSPAAPVTRAQMATFLVRAAEFARNEALPIGGDAFDDDNGDSHEERINKAAAAGFATGVAPRTYRPLGNVRRDQMARFLSRVLDRSVSLGDALVPVESVSVSQVGDELTDRFRLRSGAEYRVDYNYANDCFYGAFLSPEDDDYRSYSLPDDTGPASGSEVITDVEAADYRIEMFTGSDCEWQMTLARVR